MINQEEYLPNQPEHRSINYFVDDLLREPNIDSQFFAQQQAGAIKQPKEHQLANSENQANSPPSINILEKRQCYSFLPQRFFEYVGDEGLEEMPEIVHVPALEKLVLIKKSIKTNKFAYFEETRAIKIQRYKQKKTKRVWNRKISYDCRKIVADNRQRVNGRFVKKSPIQVSFQPPNKSSCKTKDSQAFKQFNEPDKAIQDFSL